MNTITDHKVSGVNEAITIEAVDRPGPGGANHVYDVRLPGWSREPVQSQHKCCLIEFQKGPIGEAGVNGLTNEALLAILIHRMKGFQFQRKGPEESEFDVNSRGEFACRENALALTHLEEALHWLQHRTRARVARGVEGFNKA